MFSKEELSDLEWALNIALIQTDREKKTLGDDPLLCKKEIDFMVLLEKVRKM